MADELGLRRGEDESEAAELTDFPADKEANFLSSEQLDALGQAFADWVRQAKGKKSVISRTRARLVYLMLRYTGARLGEVLSLDDREDFALAFRKIVFRAARASDGRSRDVYLPHELYSECKQALRHPDYASLRGEIFRLDQGYMRRVISERAAAAGIPRPLANPNTIRRSRAIELWREGVPLVVVQRILGHTSANSTAAFLDLTEQDQRRVEKYYFSQEGQREEDSVNALRGRIEVIEKCENQARIVVSTTSGLQLTVMISARTLSESRYRVGDSVTVKTKAPWLTVSAEDCQALDEELNCLHALVERVSRGRDAAKVLMTLDDGRRLRALIGLEQANVLDLKPGLEVWAVASPYAMILSH